MTNSDLSRIAKDILAMPFSDGNQIKPSMSFQHCLENTIASLGEGGGFKEASPSMQIKLTGYPDHLKNAKALLNALTKLSGGDALEKADFNALREALLIVDGEKKMLDRDAAHGCEVSFGGGLHPTANDGTHAYKIVSAAVKEKLPEITDKFRSLEPLLNIELISPHGIARL